MNNINSKRQAAFFGNFVNNFSHEVPKFVEDDLLKPLNLSFTMMPNPMSIQITPFGPPTPIMSPALKSSDNSFVIRFSQTRIDIEEDDSEKDLDIKQFIDKVLVVFRFFSEKQKLKFGRIALNGNIFLELNNEQMIEYYKHSSKFTNLVKGEEFDWIIGESKCVKMDENETINVKFSIAKNIFITGATQEEKSIIHVNYDINTTHKNLFPRFNYTDSSKYFEIFQLLRAEILKGILK